MQSKSVRDSTSIASASTVSQPALKPNSFKIITTPCLQTGVHLNLKSPSPLGQSLRRQQTNNTNPTERTLRTNLNNSLSSHQNQNQSAQVLKYNPIDEDTPRRLKEQLRKKDQRIDELTQQIAQLKSMFMTQSSTVTDLSRQVITQQQSKLLLLQQKQQLHIPCPITMGVNSVFVEEDSQQVIRLHQPERPTQPLFMRGSIKNVSGSCKTPLIGKQKNKLSAGVN